METPVTFTQLIITAVFVLVTTLAPQIYGLYKAGQDAKKISREQDIEERKQDIEDKKAETQSWTTVIAEYQRQIESLRRLEIENSQLRPLAIRNAVLEQECKQKQYDKDDWKAFAEQLQAILEKNNIVPPPFRRMPREDDTDKMKTISQKMRAIQQENPSAATESPTLVFPKGELGNDTNRH